LVELHGDEIGDGDGSGAGPSSFGAGGGGVEFGEESGAQ
jgi:hypothetical protein